MPSFRSRITSNLNAASSSGLAFRVGTESNYRIDIDAGGTINWGPGGATAVDTNLYRSAASVLKTDDTFQAVGGLVTSTSAGAPSASLSDGGLSVDTTNHILYFRSGAAWKKTIDTSVTISDLATSAGELGGTWSTYTPTTGNVSGANTRTGYYILMGKTLFFQLTMATGNTATAAAAITFTLPSGVTAARTQVLSGRTSTTVGLCTVSSGTITLQANATGGNFTAGQALGTVNIGGIIEVS